MRSCINVGVDAQRHRGFAADFAGDARKAFKLAFGLDVEAEYAGLEGGTHLGFGLADARENRLSCSAACGQNARKLSAGYDVEARAQTGEHVEHREVRIGLHGVTDQHVVTRSGLLEVAVRRLQRRARIDVARCAEAQCHIR